MSGTIPLLITTQVSRSLGPDDYSGCSLIDTDCYAGCFVDSDATATRRGGIAIAFEARVAAVRAAIAADYSEALPRIHSHSSDSQRLTVKCFILTHVGR